MKVNLSYIESDGLICIETQSLICMLLNLALLTPDEQVKSALSDITKDLNEFQKQVRKE